MIRIARIPGRLKDSLDQTVQKLFHLTGMPGISAAMIVPGKGVWHIDTGFISKPKGKRIDSSSVWVQRRIGLCSSMMLKPELL